MKTESKTKNRDFEKLEEIAKERRKNRTQGRIGEATHKALMKAFPSVNQWLRNRPEGTRRSYSTDIIRFCMTMKVTPSNFQSLEPKKARDLVWQYVEPYIKDNPAVAVKAMACLKSFYRNKDGVKLPFDSARHGKHYIAMKRKRYRKEKIPNKKGVYRIVDMTTNIRDRAIALTLFQSGIRVNALCSLNYGHVREGFESGKKLLPLRITEQIDSKLQGRHIPFYYTFLNGEALECLREYCERVHKKSSDTTPLFLTSNKKRITRARVWAIITAASKRAGFKKGEVAVHSLRKAFRKVVRKSDIEDEAKEELMGHVLKGSREAYFDRQDVPFLAKEYEKADFTRVSEEQEERLTKLHVKQTLQDAETEKQRRKTEALENRLEKIEAMLKGYEKLIQAIPEKTLQKALAKTEQ